MIPIVSSERMTEIDRAAQKDYGIPGIILMEQAGRKAFQVFLDRYQDAGKQSRLVFAAGGGNNGGDALVMARAAFLEGYAEITVVITAQKLNEQMTVHELICRNLGLAVFRWHEDRAACEKMLKNADYLFDGIAGTGIKGSLRGAAAEAASCITEAGNRGDGFPVVIAVDTPSGLTADWKPGMTVVKADCTVTMGLPKVQFYLPDAVSVRGDIVLVNPGFPIELLRGNNPRMKLIEDADVSLPAFEESAFKQKRGHAAVFAGAAGTSGAAALAAEACARIRTGLVTVYCEKAIYSVLASKLTAQMVKPEMPLHAAADGRRLHEIHDAVIAGPGWGRGEHRISQLEELLGNARCGVIDADGLYALAGLVRKRLRNDDAAAGAESGSSSLNLEGKWILTPHPGEFRYLRSALSEKTGKTEKFDDDAQENLFAAIRSTAAVLNCCILYKSHVVLTCTPEGEISVIEGNNPALGTAGSGDVLAGMTGGLLAQGITPEESMVSAAYLHQKMGSRLYAEEGWFTADDLASAVSSIAADYTHA